MNNYPNVRARGITLWVFGRNLHDAYNQSPEAVAFDEFTRTIQSYKFVIADNMTLIPSTDSDLSKCVKGMAPGGEVFLARDRGGN